MVYVVVVAVFVKKEFVEQFKAASYDNAVNTRKEPGNVRFDVLQADDDPTRFTLYECYRDVQDFTDHQKTEHYLRWKATVADWMAQPRSAVKSHAVFFDNSKC